MHAGELEPLARGHLEAAVRAVLGRWGPDLAADDTLVRATLDAAAGLTQLNQPVPSPKERQPMKIAHAEVLVTSPGRNFVTLKLATVRRGRRATATGR